MSDRDFVNFTEAKINRAILVWHTAGLSPQRKFELFYGYDCPQYIIDTAREACPIDDVARFEQLRRSISSAINRQRNYLYRSLVNSI